MKIQVLNSFNLDIGNGVQKLQAKSKCKNKTPYDFDGIYYIDNEFAEENNYYQLLKKYPQLVVILN